jgi:SHS family lactate transporter-like MFS transporter
VTGSQTPNPVDTAVAAPSNPRDKWRALSAAFFGWMLDGYDYTILTFVLIEIQQEFSMTAAEAGALGTVTLVARLAGGGVAGAAADRWGRKKPLMLSILWFSVFSFLSGFSTSYSALLFCRALFGLGMGGEWAAGMPLVMEHWPPRLHGVISGVVQGAFSWGFMLAAAVVQFVYPAISHQSWGWRALLWSGLLPAVFVVWVRRGVPESPAWLAGVRAKRSESSWRESFKGAFPVGPTLLLGAMMFGYQAVSFWYGTLVRTEGLTVLPHIVALNAGGIAGAAFWGAVAGTRLGPAGAIALGSFVAIGSVPAFLISSSASGLLASGFLLGLSIGGIIGVAPIFIARTFPPERRGYSGGIVYHAATAAGAIAPVVLGTLMDGGWRVRDAMAICAIGAMVVAIVLAVRARFAAGLSTPS